MNAAHMLWSLRRAGQMALRRLGWGGVLAAVLLSALLAAAVLEWHLRQAAQAAVTQAHAAASRRLPPAGLGAATPRTLEQELAAFEAQLPPAGEAMQALADLFVLAEKHQLVLQRGEYRLQPDKAGGFVRFRMSLPIQGEARVVQRFVNEAMRTYPSLAFEALALKRDRVDAGTVQARVQWSLLMRSTEDPAAQPALVAKRQAAP